MVDSGSGLGALTEVVRTRVAQLLGPRAARDLEVLQTSAAGAVVRVRTHGTAEGAVLKVAPRPGAADGRDVDFRRTAAVIGLARGAGVPAPRVLSVDTSGGDEAWQSLLLEHVPGRPWRQVRPELDAGGVDTAQREIAEVLSAIQAITFDGFGELDGGARPTGVSLLAALTRRADRILLPGDRESFLAALASREHLFAAAPGLPVLVHDDLHHANILFDRRGDRCKLSGVIDWDKAWAGPAESDPARMAFWDGMTGRGFWEVYRRAASVPAGWQERARLLQLLWCLEYDDGSARHAHDTARAWDRLT
ncbi:hypothetical protein GCM10022204_18300 [Microlunatus aurantiacus]|uniref:Aminoglycoside phosphotransferase domain-containing protein n=1 Tax=Microlunatus aurantiacus TaxID=446786 RepID=A0ABP7DB23_9ACTN